jgi:serine/threonine-protein kinase RsbW
LIVKSRTDNLSKIRDFVYSFADDIGMNHDVIEDIILAVDEACTNIIKHAYKSYPEGDIILKIKHSASKIIISITDYGTPFQPETVPDPDLQKYYKQHRVGGLGMYLMKSLMDDVKYTSVPGKFNQVQLLKKLNSAL